MKLSLKQAAAEFGLARETLTKRLVAAGYERTGERMCLSIGEIYRALSVTEDLKLRREAALTRKAEAEARILEQEEQVRTGELGATDLFQSIEDEKNAAIRSRLVGWPDTVGPTVNPGDPEFGTERLRGAVAALMPLLQGDIRAALLKVQNPTGAPKTSLQTKPNKARKP